MTSNLDYLATGSLPFESIITNCTWPSPTYIPPFKLLPTENYIMTTYANRPDYEIRKVENGYIVTRFSREYVAADLGDVHKILKDLEKNK